MNLFSICDRLGALAAAVTLAVDGQYSDGTCLGVSKSSWSDGLCLTQTHVQRRYSVD